MHTIPPNLNAFTVELVPHFLDAIDAEVVAVHPGDLDLQLVVALLTR